MIIQEHLKKFYEIKPTDDEKTVKFKKYMIRRDKMDREQMEREQQEKEKHQEQKEFYNELNKLKGKTPLEQLEREYFINELLNK